MKRWFLFAVVFVFIFPGVVAAEEKILVNIDEAILMALRDNRDILLKAEDVKKAKLKIKEAQASLFPTLDLSAGWSLTREYYAKDLSSNTAQATLKQYLYTGGKTLNTIEQNEYKFAVANFLLQETELDTVLSVKKAFHTLLLADEFSNLNKIMLENTKEHLKFVQARYANGQASESDILEIKESLGNLEEAYEASLNEVSAAQSLLKNLLYLSEEVKIEPDGELAYSPTELTYEEAFLKSLENRPKIKQYEFQEEADKKAIEIVKADNRPEIYASWDYYSRSHAALGTGRNRNDYNVLGLTFSWPVFDGWLTKAKLEQAIVDLKETQLNREKIVKDISLEVKNAYLDLKDALAKVKSSQSETDLYSDTLLSTVEKYKSGIASMLDLSDAFLGYRISLFNQKQAIYDCIVAKARLERATGGS